MIKLKNKKLLIIILTLLLIISLFSFSYGYYLTNISGTGKEVRGNTAYLDIEFIEGESVKLDKYVPIYDTKKETDSYKKTFSIENKSSLNSIVNAEYDVFLIFSNIDKELKSEFIKWELLNDGKIINSGNLKNIINNEIKLTKNKKFIGLDKGKQNLEFRIWMSYSDTVDQMNMLNKSLTAKLKVKVNELPIGNLFINGDLAQGNKNWDPYIYDETEKALKRTINAGKDDQLGNFIEINPGGTYEQSIDMKTDNINAEYYAGLAEYDIDKNRIRTFHVMWISNTTTELTQDLKNGDTVVHLKDLTNWDITTPNDYQRGFIFWNYKDSAGYQYPIETYSRNVWLNLYINENVNKENNTIILSEPWNSKTISKGTKLSQSNSGAAYNYGILWHETLATDWITYKNEISGVNTTNTANTNFKQFREGTKYIKLVIWPILESTDKTTTYIKNISFKRIK